MLAWRAGRASCSAGSASWHGISNRNRVRLQLDSIGTGYVGGLRLKGNDKGSVPNRC
ncbi:hypothetical protein ABZV64_19160 [Streptomyces sp. NPDC004959]|uniref:hypothetical protein n=1 Tax=Streptomyces sp. NPDC004959 TaxID=3154673 RepID=UPI0033BEE788